MFLDPFLLSLLKFLDMIVWRFRVPLLYFKYCTVQVRKIFAKMAFRFRRNHLSRRAISTDIPYLKSETTRIDNSKAHKYNNVIFFWGEHENHVYYVLALSVVGKTKYVCYTRAHIQYPSEKWITNPRFNYNFNLENVDANQWFKNT